MLSFLVIRLLLRRISAWWRFANWLLLGSPLTLALVILSVATFSQGAVAAGLGVVGLTERILVIEVHAWIVALGWLSFRRS